MSFYRISIVLLFLATKLTCEYGYMVIWLPVRQLILEQINDYNLFTILSGALLEADYRLVQATENGRPRESMSSYIHRVTYELKVTLSYGDVPIWFGSQVVSCDLQPAGLKQWKAVDPSCRITLFSDSEDEFVYFSILKDGILTISDDLNYLTVTVSGNDRNGTLLFERLK